MAKKLEGLTVQLGLDTTPITSALSGLNKDFNNSQKELKEVNRLLKFDPSNTTLLAQKQELLSDSITACTDKLKVLKEAESQVQEQFERGDIKEEKYREFQREVVSTENKLKSLKSQVDTTNKTLADMGSTAKAAGEKMNAAGDKLLPLSAALTGVATAAVAAMNNVDDGIDRIATATGATGDKLKAMTDIYYDVVTKMPVEFESAGAAIGEINTRFGYLDDKLAECTEDFLKFAKVNNMDATESVRLVSRAMGDAGINASEYKRVLDLMTKAAQDSGISVSKLAESVTTFGAPMRALGFDMEESIALFASWEKAGVNAETAFSGLKKSISTWASEGKDAREEFKKTLDEIKATPDIAEATTKAIEVFGTKAGPDLADAIKGGRFEYQEFLNTLQGSTGVIDSTYGAIVDDVDATQVAIQTAQVALHDIGETIMVTGGPILKDFADGLRDVTQHFNALDDGTKKAIITASGMAIAAGPVLKATGGITTGIGNIMTGLSKLKPLIKSTEVASTAAGVASASAAALPMAPLLATVGAIAAVTAGIGLLIIAVQDQKSEERELIDTVNEEAEAWQNLKEAQEQRIEKGLEEISYTETMISKLEEMTDSEGNLTGSREQALFYINEINKVMPDAIKLNDDNTISINEGKQALDDLIKSKQAQIYLEAMEPAYKEAIINYQKKVVEQGKLAIQVNELETETLRLKAQAEEDGTEKSAIAYGNKLGLLAEMKNALEENTTTTVDMYKTIQDYEGMTVAIQSGNYDELTKMIDDYNQAQLHGAELANQNALEQAQTRYDDAVAAYEGLISLAEEKGMEITDAEIDAAKKAVNDAQSELNSIGNNMMTGIATGVAAGTSFAVGAVSSVMNRMIEEARRKAAEVNDAMNGDGYDGSHRNGLNYVPFDGYRAILHEGEKVLTKSEASAERSGDSKTEINVTQNIYTKSVNASAQQREAARAYKKMALEVH